MGSLGLEKAVRCSLFALIQVETRGIALAAQNVAGQTLVKAGLRPPPPAAKPRLEGAHAVRPRLTRRDEAGPRMRLPKTTRHRYSGLHARSQLPALSPRIATSCVWPAAAAG